MRSKNWIPVLFLSLLLFYVCVNQALAAAPVTISLSPGSGAVGATVTIVGTNFGASGENSEVRFNGSRAEVTSWSNTRIAVTVPDGAMTGNVVVRVSGVAMA